jgi:hypothetical protein
MAQHPFTRPSSVDGQVRDDMRPVHGPSVRVPEPERREPDMAPCPTTDVYQLASTYLTYSSSTILTLRRAWYREHAKRGAREDIEGPESPRGVAQLLPQSKLRRAEEQGAEAQDPKSILSSYRAGGSCFRAQTGIVGGCPRIHT